MSRQGYTEVRIFGKKKREAQTAELTLVQVSESHSYHFGAALAKALLLFMLVYGALGGFLSAFEIDYDSGRCIVVLLVLSFLVSAVYETGIRWFTNLVSILLFGIYLYMAVSKYWAINSGYYAILNTVYESARDYLGVESGIEYVVAEGYATVTVFIAFLEIVAVILLNIVLQNKCSLFKVVLLTLTPCVIPFYLECSPKPIYMIFLLAGYLCVAVLQGVNVRSGMTRQMRYVLPFAVVFAVCIIQAVSLLVPQQRYESVVPKNALKAASETDMTRLAQYGLSALLSRNSAGAGMSGGRLNKNAVIMPTYETVLKVRYTPYDFKPVYLKAFTGKDYLGDLWTPADDGLPDDGAMLASVESRAESYQAQISLGTASQNTQPSQSRGVMEIEAVEAESDAADKPYEYKPYYTYSGQSDPEGNVFSYVYYPDVYPVKTANQDIPDAYLEVPLRCRDAVAQICEEAGFHGTQEEIAEQITDYFREEYSYTLRPGYDFGDPDYISHFLLESKRGYCMHFASAATMLFRRMGIPARYVEGYAFSYYNVVENGELVENARYSDYYSGYAPLGETALIELEIPDAYAHAWVEIYVDGKGWIVADPTPAQDSQEETSSFWDNFISQTGNGSGADIEDSNLGNYLEGTFSGAAYILSAAAAALLVFWMCRRLARLYRESKLSGRERVRLEYGRLHTYLCKRSKEFRRLRTIREQISWIREHSRAVIDQEHEEALYRVYFAENDGCDSDELRRYIRRVKRAVRFGIRTGRADHRPGYRSSPY